MLPRLVRHFTCSLRANFIQLNISLLRSTTKMVLGKDDQRNLSTMFPTSPQHVISKNEDRYEDAVRTLNGLQTNASLLRKMRVERGGRYQTNSIPEIENYLGRLNIDVDDLNKLNVIHVSGTKGKGSTCAFVENILRTAGLRTGLYTSPHLLKVRERIRVNGRPISRPSFARHLFETYDRLTVTMHATDERMPGYFRFLTLMAFKIFLEEGVDVAVIEVGVGGTFDCTNVVRQPVVCGISLLGLDHTAVLGNTIEEIAWHKAGIMKHGRPAVTIPQRAESAMDVLYSRASELGSSLTVSPSLDEFSIAPSQDGAIVEGGIDAKLSLDGEHQKVNAALALQLCRIWFMEMDKRPDNLPDMAHKLPVLNDKQLFSSEVSASNSSTDSNTSLRVPSEFLSGLANTTWEGRCQTISRPAVTVHLDGAHTVQSVDACMNWFSTKLASPAPSEQPQSFRILLFNLSTDRDPKPMLKIISKFDFDYAVFCPSVIASLQGVDSTSGSADQSNFNVTRNEQLDVCLKNQHIWIDLRNYNASDPEERASIFPNISEAVRWIFNGRDAGVEKPVVNGPYVPHAMALAKHIDVLVVGSLHLVGAVLQFLGSEVTGIED